jgi:hypothetical protein
MEQLISHHIIVSVLPQSSNLCDMLCSFGELAQTLEPGKPAKTDKMSIISDAQRIVTQLRAENGQLKQLNKFLEVGFSQGARFP